MPLDRTLPCWLTPLVLAVGLTLSRGASAQPEGVDEPPIRTDSSHCVFGLGLHLSPLEDFPRAGVALEAHHRWKRWWLGGELNVYLPREFGDVSRQAYTLDGRAHLVLHQSPNHAVYLPMGVGLALFKDDYAARSAFDDERSVAPGVMVGVGGELRLVRGGSGFLEVRALSYPTNDIADDEWVQVTLGARWDPSWYRNKGW